MKLKINRKCVDFVLNTLANREKSVCLVKINVDPAKSVCTAN